MLGFDLKAILGVIIVLLCGLLWASNSAYRHEMRIRMQTEANFKSFSEGVKADGVKAEEEKKKLIALHEDNLKTVKVKYEARTTEVESNAVANYINNHPTARMRKCLGTSPSSGSLSPNPLSQPVDDGTQQELISVEQELIKECANDANKVSAWIAYCRLNNCPVEP